ncbi:hypothetical protein SDC9_139399 [bioreactor metagenome]|uniref:Uncharacterized protein n=1 Tax=bioreactor metagenome TaxID=1076179 RepID=A0A645DS10_9ZZZZ
MVELYAAAPGQQQHAEVVGATHPRRAIAERVGVCLGVVHQLPGVLERLVVVHHQHVVVAEHRRDRREVLGRIERHLGHHVGADGDGGTGGKPERQPVGLGARDLGCCHGGVGAGLVFDDDGRAQFLGQCNAQKPRALVNRPASGVADQQAYRLRILRQCGQGAGGPGGQGNGAQGQTACGVLHALVSIWL